MRTKPCFSRSIIAFACNALLLQTFALLHLSVMVVTNKDLYTNLHLLLTCALFTV